MTEFALFNGGFHKAQKEHLCWLCAKPILPGERYFRTTGLLHGRMFAIKHHRSTCELAGDIIDQNPDLRERVLSPTIGG